MGRAQFEYDEVGNTFYYVIVSFYAVVLFPLTYFLWPSARNAKNVVKAIGCQCEGDLSKRAKKAADKPWERTKKLLKVVVLLVLWSLFLFLVYKVRNIEHEFAEYDPYKILQLDVDADTSEIKKKYRELSKLHHPDKGGKAETFDDIVKAYKALTDDEARENWRLYGNPDGPKAMTFGIALPKWIVSEKYGSWVLGLYVLIFMVILPLFVGLWWYNSMKYSADKVLLETTRLYYYFLQKTPSMEVNRIIMVLAGSFEFWKRFNATIIERETDDVEIPRAMKELRNLGENKKESPFCHPWSIKARTLIHAHFSRVDLHSSRLETDQQYMVGRLLALMEEYLRVLLQMMLQIPLQRPPTIETLALDNTLRLFPMCVQALWPKNSNLLQLPHVYEHNISFLRKNRVSTCQDLASINEFKRKVLLNTISPEQYEDVIYVLSMMPKLEIETRIEVQGEDDKETVTVGSLVTIKVTLKRSSLLDLERRRQEIVDGPLPGNSKMSVQNSGEHREQHITENVVDQSKRKAWEKPPKKKPKRGGGKPAQKGAGKKAATTSNFVKVPSSPQSGETAAAVTAKQTEDGVEASPKTTKSLARKEKPKKPEPSEKSGGSDSEGADDSESDSASSGTAEDESGKANNDELSSNNENANILGGGGGEDEDMEDWNDADLGKRETLLESEPTDNYEVHCPFFPGEKFEWWYIYLVERKSRRLVSSVVPCKTLKHEKTVELKFVAPPVKGSYYFTVNVRSDSYLDFDYSSDLKMEVHPAREPVHVKYEDTDEEDEDGEKDDSGSSEDYTEGSDTEEET